MTEKTFQFSLPADTDIGATAVGLAFMSAADQIGLSPEQISALCDQAMRNLKENISISDA